MKNSSKPKPINWPKQVAAWKVSGLSMNQFCQQHGLAVHQLGYYKRQYESTNTNPSKGFSGFVKVSVSKQDSAQVLTLRLLSGHVIEGISPQNLPLVNALVRALS